MKTILSVTLAIAVQLSAGALNVHAQAACRFVLGFADMVDYVGAAEVGPCLENQRTITGAECFAVDGFSSVGVEAGASVQWTGRGLLVWHPSDNSTQFYSRRGIWFQSASGSNFVSMAELTAPSAPPSPPTPVPPAVQSQRNADADCFNIYSSALIGTLYLSPAESDRVKAEADAANYLCHQAADRDGPKGVDCHTGAWDAARGMERVFQGSGRKVYDDKYASCIGR